jgi:glycosyltransferase involved in cell wall biosynthesis
MLTRDFDDTARANSPRVTEYESGIASGRAAPTMRALFYSCFPGGGIGRYTHELLGRLRTLPGLEVELACLPGFHWRDAADYPVWAGLRDISHPLPWRRRSRFLIGQFVNPSRLFRRARQTGAGIVHLSNINHLTYAWWKGLAKPRSVQLVATAHDVRRAKAMLSRTYEDHQLRRFYRRADALFVHSRAQAEELHEFAGVPPERIHQVPHGPYDYGRPSAESKELRARLGWPQDRQIALCFGNIRDDKNLELLLRSWPRFSRTTHLVVAGRGGGRPHQPVSHYKALAAGLSLTNAVTFLDQYIPDPMVADLFGAADWVALPYSRSFTSQSGVLNVAVCYDRPVLASGAATFTETLEQCDIGVVVPPDDIDALVAGIEALQKRLAQGHPHEFEKYRRMFSWDEAARRTLAVYRTLCGTA